MYFYFETSSFSQDKDILRTIGIDTDYIESTDFALEMVDKEFLIEVSSFIFFIDKNAN